MRYSRIPDETIRRLPIYLRGLMFISEQGQTKVSSKGLAELLGVNSWQIRKDFSHFGEFGTPGVGYKIEVLTDQIKKILKLDDVCQAALVGVGNLGSAVLTYPGFGMYSVRIAAAFDSHPKKVGKTINGIKVEDISNLKSLAKRKIEVAIIAVPQRAAQEMTDKLVQAGVKGILNFSPCYISTPESVKVITIDIAIDLARLPYYMPTG
ncbi:MAG: redox-sensing transcriptional repressor Rex [Planctomycetota bacterium]